MSKQIGVAGRRLSVIVTMVLLVTGCAFAQNGKLVNAAPVTFGDDALKKLEVSHPTIRSILDQVDIQSITYLSDGLKIKGYMAVPKKGEKLPCVIFNRGGSKFVPGSDINDEKAVTFLGTIATWGYVVVASQYRGNAGSEGQDEMGGADVDDVLNLIPLLESVPKADASRVAMYGWSRGGMETYIALTKTDRIAAAVIGGGVADTFDNMKKRPEMETVYAGLIPNYAQHKEAALAARSAVRWPEKLYKKTPILLLQGGADWRTPPSQVLAMATALYESKHPFRFVFFEGGDHGLSEYRAEVNRLVKDWLDRYVRDRKPWPSLEPHGQ